ncbi:MAG: hypothetical protein J0H98_04390 [Solirubrobacterales bacterium]|nr:hypothetical protein [Solirubrobacterales bacterium]
MELHALTEDQKEAITAKGVSEAGVRVLDLMLVHLRETVGRETRTFDEDEGDDSRLMGQACTKKPKNLVARDVRESDDPEFRKIEIVEKGMGIYFIVEGVRLHLYSAQEGPDGVHLGDTGIQAGISARAEATEQLFSTDQLEVKPDDVLMMYARDLMGLRQVWLGRIGASGTFLWLMTIHDRKEEPPTSHGQDSAEGPKDGPTVPKVTLKSGLGAGKKGSSRG